MKKGRKRKSNKKPKDREFDGEEGEKEVRYKREVKEEESQWRKVEKMNTIMSRRMKKWKR